MYMDKVHMVDMIYMVPNLSRALRCYATPSRYVECTGSRAYQRLA